MKSVHHGLLIRLLWLIGCQVGDQISMEVQTRRFIRMTMGVGFRVTLGVSGELS